MNAMKKRNDRAAAAENGLSYNPAQNGFVFANAEIET